MIKCAFEDGNSVSLRHVVVDVLVLKDNKLLLVKRTKKLLEGGKWSLAGGFAERDETLVQAAEREVFEETGWQVKGTTLLAINGRPDRPNEDRQNVSFIYFCRGVKKAGDPDWESDEQDWFDLDELPPKDVVAFDHADFIDLYKRYVAEKLPLPILY